MICSKDCPYHVTALEMRSDAHKLMKNINKAVEDLHRIQRMSTDRPDIFYTTSQLFYENGQPEKAKE